MNIAVVNFSGGEYSPKIDCRADTEKYASGCRTCKNMIPMIFGGATRRPGTEWISRDAIFETMIVDIIACENAGLCYENNVVNETYTTFLNQLICYENDIGCYENEIVVDSPLISKAGIVICYENNVLFYENEIVLDN